MNPQFWWYVSRAAGVIAWAAVAASIVWGLAASTRITAGKPTPAWLIDLHRYLGGLAVTFTALHLWGLGADNYVHFGWSETFVPMASPWKTGAVAWGIVAFYLLLAVEVTSLMMRWLPRRLWRGVHYLSFGLFLTGTVHGVAAGTDISNRILLVSIVVGIHIVLFLTIVRILAPRRGGTRPRPVAVPTTETPRRQRVGA